MEENVNLTSDFYHFENILEPEKHMLDAHDTDVQNDAEIYKSTKMDPGPFGSELFN